MSCANSLIISHVGGTSWLFQHRNQQFHWLVVLSKSFEIMFRQRVFKTQLLVTQDSTFQVLHWKHCLAIWTQIREFFIDKNPLVEVGHIDSRPLAKLETAWWPRRQGVVWAGVVATSLLCPTWQLCKSQLSSRMYYTQVISKYEAINSILWGTYMINIATL